MAKEARRGINQLVRRLRLPDSKTLAPKRDWSSLPHPYLAAHPGLLCRSCPSRTTSRKLAIQHLGREHGSRQAGSSRYRGDQRQRWLHQHLHLGVTLRSWDPNDPTRSWVTGTSTPRSTDNPRVLNPPSPTTRPCKSEPAPPDMNPSQCHFTTTSLTTRTHLFKRFMVGTQS